MTADHTSGPPAPYPGAHADASATRTFSHLSDSHGEQPATPWAERGPRPDATLAATCAATFFALMNYVAPLLTVPDLSAALHTSGSTQAWLLNGTPLGLAALLLVAGSIADDYGRRRVFLLGTLALAVTTGLTTLATDTLFFTVTRVAQGAASAAIIASSLGLLVHAFPAGHARVRATGVWGAFVSGGIAVGPLLAGALGGFDWRILYLVLALATLAVTGMSVRALTESRAPRGARPDTTGAVVFGLSLTALLTALTLGRDGWLRLPVLLLLAATVALLVLFTLVERHAGAPLINLGLLRRPAFQASVASGLFTGLAVIGFFSVAPLLVEHALGMSVMATAWLFVAWSGTSAVIATQAKRLPARVSVRHQLVIGFVLHAAGVLSMLGAVGAGSEARLLPGALVAGAGSGLLNAGLPRLAVESVPQARAAMGSGANNTARYIGSSAGVALLLAVSTGDPAHGANVAILVSVGLTLLGALTVLTRKTGSEGR
jgi:MFS family permease